MPPTHCEQQKFAERLKQTFSRNQFPLSTRQIEQLTRYRSELRRWNAVMNLTAITEDVEILEKHFLDSLSILNHITLTADDAVIDIGTGAGFPGIVLKIYVPDIRLTLVEASQKKVSFLKFLISQLGLEGTIVLASRAEDCAQQPVHTGAYDWVVTRYVASLAESAGYCVPLLKSNGKWVAYKSGAELSTEIRDSEKRLTALGGTVETVFSGENSGAALTRSYIVVRRLNATSFSKEERQRKRYEF